MLVVSPALALYFPVLLTYIALTINYVMVSTESSVEDVPCIPAVSVVPNTQLMFTQIICLMGGMRPCSYSVSFINEKHLKVHNPLHC